MRKTTKRKIIFDKSFKELSPVVIQMLMHFGELSQTGLTFLQKVLILSSRFFKNSVLQLQNLILDILN